MVLSGLSAVDTHSGEIDRKDRPSNLVAMSYNGTHVDINSGDVRGATIAETPLSKEVRRLGIAVPAERKWMLMSSHNDGTYVDSVYRFVPGVGAMLVRLLDETHTPDEERRVTLEKFMTNLRTEGPLQAQTQGYLLIQEIADKHGLHVFLPSFEKQLRRDQESRKNEK